MRTPLIAGFAAAAACAAAALPAAAQPYPPPESRTRAGRVADEIARTVRETAAAVATVRDSVDSSLYDVRYGRAERFAIAACRPRVERYGRMQVERVEPYGRRSFRVIGLASALGVYGDRYGAGRYDRGYDRRYARSASSDRSFACTVREDGRVKLKTRKLRRY